MCEAPKTKEKFVCPWGCATWEGDPNQEQRCPQCGAEGQLSG